MEPVHGTCETSKFELEDIISNMPENVRTHILDRLPFQEAVRTSILSKNWRFSWTTLTQLVFDHDFIEYLLSKNRLHLFYKKNLYQILLQHKGYLTKFVLYVLCNCDITVDIDHWIRYLSTKRLNKFFLINMCDEPLKLSDNIFSCHELKHLQLYNCWLCPVPGLHCFQNLLTFDFEKVTFEGCKYGEFVTCCPLLADLEITYNKKDGMRLVEIGKLKNLKQLVLAFCGLEDMVIKSSNLFRSIGFLTKLEVLDLNFYECKFLAEVGAKKASSATWPCLKFLALHQVDLSNHILVFVASKLISDSPKLESLYIGVTDEASTLEVDFDIRGNLQLQSVMLTDIRGLQIELSLIKSLLASSPLLEKMEILKTSSVDETHWCMFGEKLLKLPRASPIAEIDWFS